MEIIKVIALTYVVCFGGMYYVASRYGRPPVLPGDLYRVNKVGRMIYFPFGSALILTVLMVILLKVLQSRYGV